MPGDQERTMVLTVLAGVKAFFDESPDMVHLAEDMWSHDGTSVNILTRMIEQRCKEKAAEGEVSRLEPWNCEGGAEKLRATIMSYAKDEEVGKYMKIIAAHTGRGSHK